MATITKTGVIIIILFLTCITHSEWMGGEYRVYYVPGGSNDWYNANQQCIEQGYDSLATIETDDDYLALRDAKDTTSPNRNQIADGEPFWVGLYRQESGEFGLYRQESGEFAWIDNTQCETDDGLCVSDWLITPDLTVNTEYCVTLTVDSTTKARGYTAVSCNTDYRYVCSLFNATITSPTSTMFEGDGDWIAPIHPLLPQADTCQAIGYYDGEISIVGGGEEGGYDLIEYDISHNNFTYLANVIPSADDLAYFYAFGQYWTQMESDLYMIYNGRYIQYYDLSASIFHTKWLEIPIDVTYSGCIASSTDQNTRRNTLYVVGGRQRAIQNPKILSTTQIYDFFTQTWSFGPEMNYGRHLLSCIVTPSRASTNRLYAIGGWTEVDGKEEGVATNTIEYSLFSNSGLRQWKLSKNGLTVPLHGVRSVYYRYHIFVIGGFVRSVHIIDTIDDSVELWSERLVYGVSYSAPIIVDDILYVFGGYYYPNGQTKRWQYYDLSTMARFDADDDEQIVSAPTDADEREKRYIYVGIGVSITLLSAIFIGVIVWRYNHSRKGFKEYMGQQLTNEYGSVELTQNVN